MPAGAVVRPRTMCWSEPQIFVVTTLRMTPWSIVFPAGLRKVGKSIFWTSTLPGLKYTTPRLEGICKLLSHFLLHFDVLSFCGRPGPRAPSARALRYAHRFFRCRERCWDCLSRPA